MTSKFRDYDWMAALFYPLAVILMESFWVYPWLVWLGNLPMFSQPRPPLSLVSVIITLGAATLAVRYFQRKERPVWLAQVTIIGTGLAVILLVLAVEYHTDYSSISGNIFSYTGRSFGNIFTHPDTIIIALPALLYLWWRGINLGQSTSFFRSIYNAFLLGIIALVVLVIMWKFSSSSYNVREPASIGFNVIAFFFFGLLAIAIGHLYTMRNAMPKEEAGMTSAWRWLPTMLIVIGGMVILILGVTGIFSEGFISGLGHGIGVVSHFLGKILDYVIIPLNYVFEAIVWVLKWLIARLRTENSTGTDNITTGSLADLFPDKEPAPIPPVVYLIFKVLVVIVVVAAVLFFLARAVSRYRARRALEDIEQLDESLLNWSNLSSDMKELLAMMAKKMQRKKAPLYGVNFNDDEIGQLDIREIYRRLLWEAERSGLARKHHETPAEYSARVIPQVLNSSESVSHLTEIYTHVRYGESVPSEEKLAGANGVWRTLRSLLRGHRGE